MRHIVGQKFERDETVQPRVLSLINDTHPAATEFLDDAVMRDGLADEGLRFRHLASMVGCTVRQVNGYWRPRDVRRHCDESKSGRTSGNRLSRSRTCRNGA